MTTQSNEAMERFAEVVAEGNRGHHHPTFTRTNWLVFPGGFRMSVIAGGGTHCEPRPAFCSCAWVADLPPLPPGPGEVAHDYPGPYSHVEVGFPSQRPEPWAEWEQYAESPERPTGTVYSRVPIMLVRALLLAHGEGTVRP